MQAVVAITEGSLRGQKRWLRSGQQLTIGSSAWADFVVDEAELEPIHLLIDVTPEACFIKSIGSASFQVNGLPQFHGELRHADQIRVGDFGFQMELRQAIDGDADDDMETNARQTKPTRVLLPVRCEEYAVEYRRFSPTEPEISARAMTARLAARFPVYGLCRFDQVHFPIPKSLEFVAESIPRISSGSARNYLPSFFSIEDLEHPFEFFENAFDKASLMVFTSSASREELVQFLQSSASTYLSPLALRSQLKRDLQRTIATTLGPFSAVLLGNNRSWELIAHHRCIADVATLGFASVANKTNPGRLDLMPSGRADQNDFNPNLLMIAE